MRTDDDDPLDAERRQLFEYIRQLQLAHQRELKPYVDALVRIESMRVSPRTIVTIEQAKAAGLLPHD
jgi:hypothetical protein